MNKHFESPTLFLKAKTRVSKILVAFTGTILLLGCNAQKGGNAPGAELPTPEPTPTPTAATPALACTAPTSLTLDYGSKIGVAGTARGIWSDVKYIPTGVSSGSGSASGNVVQYSANVGVAYVDTGSQNLKYSYWNSGIFKTEIVFGDAAANITYVRLGFLSNSPNTGIPIIFFSNGAVNSGQIMMAVRNSASLTTTGTWTVQPIDSSGGSSNRALEISISPIDQVGLIYQGTTSPTTNNIRFIYCTSDCVNPANYVSQGATATSRIDAGATATQLKLGIGWCQMSLGVYNPTVVYGASALTHQLAICNTGGSGNDLSSCSSNANWIKTTAKMNATGASGTVSELYLDPSILGDTPKIMIKDVGGARMTTYSTSDVCNSVGTATTYTAAGASSIVGAGIAAFANSYLKILKAPDYTTPANERFFMVANDGTTALKWSASSTSNFNGAWNANASTAIHTVTLNTAGGTNIGADLNTTTKQLISSYGTAAGLFNITLGVVNDYSSPGDPASASNIYYQLPVDDTGHMQMNATQYNNIAVAATSTHRPAVVWVDFSSGVATTGRLKYSLRKGAAASDAWPIISVPGAFGTPAPQNPSIAFDHNDRPWIGYWDAQATGAGRFILTTNSEIDGSGVWTNYMFPVVAAGHGAPAAQPASNSVAVAMSYSAGVASPVMIVIDNGTTLAVRSAKLNTDTRAWSTVTVIETLAAQGGAFLTADFSTTSNLVTIAYQSLTTGLVRVKYSASTDGGATWPVNSSVPASVSGVAQGEGAVIKINPATGNPAISYYDRANSRLYFAQCTANCTGTSAPTFTGTSVAALNGLGISGLSAAGNPNLLNAGLTFSASGDAYFLFNSGTLDTGSLRLVDNVGGVLPSGVSTVVVPGINGAFTNASASNGGIPWGQRSHRLQNGVLANAYITPGNYLGITTCGD